MDENIPRSKVSLYITALFVGLFTAYGNANLMVAKYGNLSLYAAVVAYGAVLMLLFAAIPYMLGEKSSAGACVSLAIAYIVLGIGIGVRSVL